MLKHFIFIRLKYYRDSLILLFRGKGSRHRDRGDRIGIEIGLEQAPSVFFPHLNM